MRSVKVRYGEVTREAKLRLKEAAKVASLQPATPERIEEARILEKFKKRAREDYGTNRPERLMSVKG
ncbi:hypothetical protein [Tritonibacter mobilis]|uniref:hypothetical protein n=1 Tax=Tritonibacter mobilis TaxID=379347 RepID=UPI000806C855|nr:hypothetical protein [Tritonibacter mobilis]